MYHICTRLQTLLCIAIKCLKRFLRSVLLLLTSFRVPHASAECAKCFATYLVITLRSTNTHTYRMYIYN